MGRPATLWRRAAACAAFAVGACTPLACGGGAPPPILLVTLDTTRADHLGAYGHRRDTSPHLDALAAEGTLYTRAHSTSSWTLPSHASLFTGKFPSSHGARYDPEGPLVLGSEIIHGGGIRARGLSADERTLASRLAEAGYDTAGFVAGPWLIDTFGLARGFAHWDDEGILDVNGRPAEALADATLAWLEEWRGREPRRPFFVFVNFFDAHYPYTAPATWARRFLPEGTLLDSTDRSQFDALYDAEIRYADEHLGRLLSWLRERGLYDETLIVITADHGEMMGEHEEWGHNGILYEPLVRIPLVVKEPGQEQGRVDPTPIQHPDVFDRVLRAAGLDPPESPRPRLAEVFHPEPGTGRWKVLWDGDLKYMEHSGGDHRLYDLAGDRRERVNRLADRPEDARRLHERLASEIAALPKPPRSGDEAPVEVDAATRRALERLGYLDPAEEPGDAPPAPAP